jgi:hypothetical protein
VVDVIEVLAEWPVEQTKNITQNIPSY